MQAQMKLDAAALKALREEKSWSQEHLADAAGLSARTVQRVEAEGRASGQTRLALAAALDVPVSRLSPVVAPPVSSGHRRGRFWGWLGLGLGAAGAAAGIAIGLMGGTLAGGEAGVSAGCVGALLGVCAAMLGYADRRVRTGATPPNSPFEPMPLRGTA